MKIVCSMVTSKDGFIADLQDKTVSEDIEWQEFKDACRQYNNYIIGRKSFDLSPELLSSVECEFKIVVSKKPMDEVAGVTVVDSPEAAVALLEGEVEAGLLVGGSRLNSSFANENLINEIHITEKPIDLEIGTPFFDSTLTSEPQFNLIKTDVLSGGRSRHKYTVLK